MVAMAIPALSMKIAVEERQVSCPTFIHVKSRP